jgi:hypothetical protein
MPAYLGPAVLSSQPAPVIQWFVGLDLGQAHDFTALCVLERKDHKGQLPLFNCRHLWRVREIPYPDVVEQVLELIQAPEMTGKVDLVVDYTGCGRAVVDLFRRAGLRPIAVTIHGGDAVTRDGESYRVPKRDLVGAVTTLMQSGRLRFAAKHELTPVLREELQNFKVRIDAVTAHDSYSAWREGQHDDLVLAVAIAAWWASRPRATLAPSLGPIAL